MPKGVYARTPRPPRTTCLKCDGPLEETMAQSNWKVCLSCRRGYQNGRRAAHPEYYQQRDRTTRQRHPERARASWKKYQAAHREELRQRALARYWADPESHRQRLRDRKYSERHREWTRQWVADNRWRVYAAWCNRRARVAGASGAVDPTDLRRMFARFSGLCAYCLVRKAGSVDHVLPLARGGQHTIGNLLPACKDCNSSKHARTITEWRHGRIAHRGR